ncbi:hypothetical protein PF006_g8749 [Phytophthora fragariae]|uniref:ISXO2-like transposase domain-containing protein n=1 Tax=Phytophthora fragariae TaxID=53985 RepID=A0A6A3U547_9STRA|nr:hypothetical protein PF009_g10572 [Phytophthora fragariae]KAE9146483.1 hypothetical protein PF006_g8749 [Phytophthora fragariae]
MPRSRAARLRASRTPDDAELNVMQLAPAEPSPYVYVPSAPETSAYTFDKIMASVVERDHGHIVEVDETSLKKKSKYGRGHQHPDNWLFGDVDRTINLCTIISDDFASYVSVNGKHTRLLRGMDYTHRWVNHDECLVDPVTGAHTNRIKGAWVVRIKPHLKRMRGVRKELLAGYLDESLCETWFFAGKVHVCTYLEGLAMVIRKHYQA